jgi:hypothetical protein
MKHLKKFNESNKDYYSSITFVEMQELHTHNRELFNDDEVKSIVSKQDKFFYELFYLIKGNRQVGVETIEFRDKQYGPSDIKFYISKYEDEWYGIEYYKAVALKYQISYYKCDQFEGLLKFLDDIKKPLS